MRTVLILSLSLLASFAWAGRQTGTVEKVVVRASDGLVHFLVNGSPASGKPGCASNPYWMIKDENSNVGRLQYSLVLSAHASGKPITVVGSNTCSRWASGEDVDSIVLSNP